MSLAGGEDYGYFAQRKHRCRLFPGHEQNASRTVLLVTPDSSGNCPVRRREYVGFLKTHVEQPESICFWRLAVDDYRRHQRVFARFARTVLVVARLPDHDDDHSKGRRRGIRLGEGMVPGAGIPEASPPSGS